ncbi:MAG: BamA/TamA family outer membrane protein [Gemmatimonadota bacterium]
MRRFLFLATAFLVAAPARSQQLPLPDTHYAADAFLDAGAAVLMNNARDVRARTDSSIRSYTAVVRSRFAAGLRMPLKDRTLYRQESAARVRWSRDAATIVHLLGSREQHPGGIEASTSGFSIDELFDPSQDRMYFGLGSTGSSDSTRSDNDDFWIEHPLGDSAERFYRYLSGDTLTITLHGGRVVRVIELVVIPRTDDPHTVRGALWTDAASGALVRAAFRLARKVDILRDMDAIDDDDLDEMEKVPGFLKPMEFDISLMTVEYSLWELDHWLPHSMRIDGVIRAGVISAPASAALSYDIEDILLDGESSVTETEMALRTAAEWASAGDHTRVERNEDGRPVIVLAPTDTTALLRSELLPPPIWTDSDGFLGADELQRIVDRIEDLPGPQSALRPPLHVGWGWGEPGMLRYNRVEALSVGARVTQPLPGIALSAIARIGVGDLHPNGEIGARRETLERTLVLRAFHALATTDIDGAAFGFGNSVSALLLGRDEGEYYRATGAALTWAPPPLRRQSWDLTGYVEDQRAVERNTDVAVPRLWDDAVFRPNIVADRALQYGAALRFRPWWGTEYAAPQFGIDALLQPEAGDYEHARASITLRAAAPLFRGVRIGLEAAAGSSVGDVPVQRLFYLGGASTLRGYEPSTVSGTSMARGRLELARAYPFANLALFSDWGWAGDRDDIRNANQRLAVGIGASLLDGLIRIDLAHGLREPRGWRVDLHMDSLL